MLCCLKQILEFKKTVLIPRFTFIVVDIVSFYELSSILIFKFLFILYQSWENMSFSKSNPCEHFLHNFQYLILVDIFSVEHTVS